MNGTIVLDAEGIPGVVVDKRGNMLVVIKSNNGVRSSKNPEPYPYIDYILSDSAAPAIETDTDNFDRFHKYLEFYMTALKYSQAYKSVVQKASYTSTTGGVSSHLPSKAALVPKQVTIRSKGKSYSAIRWVKVKAPKVQQRKQTEAERKEMTPKQRLALSWKEKLTPSVEEHKAIVEGDREALGKYVMRSLWEKGVGQVETVKTVSFTDVVSDVAKRITGVRPEGFEPEDIMQEVAVRLMDMQDSGKFANNQVPRENFASFLAQTVRNTSLEILRKQQLDKVAEKDITEFADMIADVRQAPLDEQMDTGNETEKVTTAIKNTYIKLPTNQKIVLNKILNGKNHLQIAKELKITPDSVKGLAKRAYSSIVGELRSAGVNIPSNVPGVTKEIKSILLREFGKPAGSKSFKAQIFLRDGKIIMKGKPAEVGEVRDYNGVKKKKVAPGKWEIVGSGKQTQKDSSGTDKVQKKEEVRQSKAMTRDKMKATIKDALKGFINTLTDVFSGRGGGETAAGEAQRTGAQLKGVGESSKQTGIKKKSLKEMERQNA